MRLLFGEGNDVAANLARARALLATPSPIKEPQPSEVMTMHEQRVLPCPCPCCGRSHDHHRDLRARVRAQIPFHTQKNYKTSDIVQVFGRWQSQNLRRTQAAGG
jgi:hypothetical protein